MAAGEVQATPRVKIMLRTYAMGSYPKENGTTLVAIRGTKLVIGDVGDSRAYLSRWQAVNRLLKITLLQTEQSRLESSGQFVQAVVHVRRAGKGDDCLSAHPQFE